MAYTFKVNTGYPRIRRYCAQGIGGLEARPELAASVADWEAMKQRVRAEHQAREDVDDKVIKASAAARVADAGFDACLGDVSARAFELAGKDASAEPYVTLFGKITAQRAKRFGPAKAIDVGTRVVRDGRRLAPEMGSLLDALEAATQRLDAAFKAFEAAEDELFAPRQAKKKLVRDLNLLVARTEAAVLTAFPGNEDLVVAILTPVFARKAPKATGDAEPDPLTPDLDDEPDEDEQPT